jgi:CelD/BcsL family acetyltransferase involved in cellulose biosynthesis
MIHMSQSTLSTSEISTIAPRFERNTEVSFAFQPITDLHSLAASWRTLEKRSEASFFQSWDWIEPWVVEAQIKPWVLSARVSGELALLALFTNAMQHRHGVIRSNSLLLHHTGERARDVLSVGYNGFVIDAALDGQIVTQALEHLRRVATLPFVEIQLNRVSEVYWRRAQMTGFRTVLLCRNPSWRVDLATVRRSGGGYLESLSGNTRYQIRRSIKLYKRRGNLTLTTASSVKEALDYFRQLRDLNISYWASRRQTTAFSYPFFERFHRRLIERCIPKGTVELVRVNIGEIPIGFLYNFVSNGQVYAYQSGFAYESDPKLKPGLVSHELCIEKHLKEGAEIYDFLAGQARYKANLGVVGPDLFDCSLQRPSFTLQTENLLRLLKRHTVLALSRIAQSAR